jgi:phosphohistidine phosphatase
MQRTLVLIRHAKSSWSDPSEKDLDRPLNERGKKDAPLMGDELKKRNMVPDAIISSTAKRARQTAKRIAKAVGFDVEQIQKLDSLYLCEPSAFKEVITNLESTVKTVFIIAHNPGITEFANQLSNQFRVDDMPTCAIITAQTSLKSWQEFNEGTMNVILFEYPKQFYDSN